MSEDEVELKRIADKFSYLIKPEEIQMKSDGKAALSEILYYSWNHIPMLQRMLTEADRVIAGLEAENARLREALESCGNIGEVRVWNIARRALGGIQRESDQ
jgi:hypothetical protein